ncbi:Uncharacterized conserved protein, DUF885 familyt [Granulicella rosea]|uniref:Uncharacterized conserved protein, DUF885 familyt n=1 Tax=Granulicella rosea TaxID=474952 RepID=A0A239D8H0_9BACT|nr:DUF885 domain-containing protein [Granulicella rosea]SNS28675.1 Uncharacterized conserved protein, DUF885 familyt [Granulicella rosea]
MRTSSLSLLLAGCLALSAVRCVAAAPDTLAQRLAAQNALFDEQYEAGLKESPERATAFGDYRFNDKMDDYSLAGVERRHAAAVAYLARIKAIPTAGFSEQDVLSHQLFERMLQQGLDNYDMKEFEMPVSQVDGPHLGLADLPNAMPFDSVKHYEDYIARLHQVPRVFAQTEEVLKAGMKDGLMPVKFLLEKVPVQCEGTIAADPFLLPLKKFPASFSDADKARLTRELTDAVNTDVLPAYKAFSAWIATDYAPHGRTALAITSLPGGAKRYQNDIRSRTTTDLTPEFIHNLGLTEIGRITAEMTVIAKQQGFPDLASFRKSINSDPKWVPTSSEQILDDFRKYIAQMQPRLPELFTYIPGAPVTVEAIPSYQAAAATHYQTGTPDGKRPGRVSVATSNYAKRTLVLDEAVAYHEGIPGHHMQLSVAQTIKGLPKFRLHSGNSGYTEGWALYAEQLGKEIGFYKDPVSDYGRLNSELFRAVRLVVDTGIHSQGWTREQVIEFMLANDVNEPLAQSETDRYIAWPAQALSYKLGQLKFRELRERAKKELGPKFDIRTFHDEMLNGGVLPLSLLDERTNQWIAAQKK